MDNYLSALCYQIIVINIINIKLLEKTKQSQTVNKENELHNIDFKLILGYS